MTTVSRCLLVSAFKSLQRVSLEKITHLNSAATQAITQIDFNSLPRFTAADYTVSLSVRHL